MMSVNLTRAQKALKHAEKIANKSLEVPAQLSGQQIARYVSQSVSNKPTGERIEVLLRQAQQFKIELIDAQTISAFTNATVSTARHLYREAIELIKGELEITPHTQTQSLKRQLKTAQEGLSALELSSSQGKYKTLTPKKNARKLNYDA
jgi:hypothetical protein